jgi:hypothetical protein
MGMVHHLNLGAVVVGSAESRGRPTLAPLRLSSSGQSPTSPPPLPVKLGISSGQKNQRVTSPAAAMMMQQQHKKHVVVVAA